MGRDRWMERLSDYLDGHMEAGERAALEAHLGACAGCRAALADLEALVAEAARLPADEAPMHLWPGIEARLRGQEADVVPLHRGGSPARWAVPLPRLAAAAMLVVALGASAVWFARAGGPPTPGAMADAGGAPVVLAATPSVEAGDYEAALERLERTLAERRDELDPETVRAVEESMAIIDAALAEAEAALERDPASSYLNRHYDATMRKKIELLRRAANAERAVS